MHAANKLSLNNLRDIHKDFSGNDIEQISKFLADSTVSVPTCIFQNALYLGISSDSQGYQEILDKINKLTRAHQKVPENCMRLKLTFENNIKDRLQKVYGEDCIKNLQRQYSKFTPEKKLKI